MTSTDNGGTFIATATTVYYETWTGATNSTTLTVTRNGTQSGIVGVDGTVIQAPLANSTFVNGGEQQPWPNDTVTTMTPYETVFQVRGLSPVTVTNHDHRLSVRRGWSERRIACRHRYDLESGVATVGTLPVSTAVTLSGTFRGSAHSGFLEAANPYRRRIRRRATCIYSIRRRPTV